MACFGQSGIVVSSASSGAAREEASERESLALAPEACLYSVHCHLVQGGCALQSEADSFAEEERKLQPLLYDPEEFGGWAPLYWEAHMWGTCLRFRL